MGQSMQSVSHVAIGVSDLDRSLVFYGDLLGFEIVGEKKYPPQDAVAENGKKFSRRVFMRYAGKNERDSVFLSISESVAADRRDAPRIEDLGINHIGIWADDVEGLMERARANGVEVYLYSDQSGDLYAEPPEVKIRTLMIIDPDGTVLQFDERLG